MSNLPLTYPIRCQPRLQLRCNSETSESLELSTGSLPHRQRRAHPRLPENSNPTPPTQPTPEDNLCRTRAKLLSNSSKANKDADFKLMDFLRELCLHLPIRWISRRLILRDTLLPSPPIPLKALTSSPRRALLQLPPPLD